MGGDKGGEQQRWAAEMATAMARARTAACKRVQAAPLIRRTYLGAHRPKKGFRFPHPFAQKIRVGRGGGAAASSCVWFSRSWNEVTAHHGGTRWAKIRRYCGTPHITVSATIPSDINSSQRLSRKGTHKCLPIDSRGDRSDRRGAMAAVEADPGR